MGFFDFRKSAQNSDHMIHAFFQNNLRNKEKKLFFLKEKTFGNSKSIYLEISEGRHSTNHINLEFKSIDSYKKAKSEILYIVKTEKLSGKCAFEEGVVNYCNGKVKDFKQAA